MNFKQTMHHIFKSFKVLLLGLPMALSLFSCSQEEALLPGLMDEAREVNLSLKFSLAADIDTRSTRPLVSINAWQRVTDMRVYLFHSATGEEGSFKLYCPEFEAPDGSRQKQPNVYIPEFEKSESGADEGIWKQPQNEQYTCKVSPLLHYGFYRLLAVGFDDPEASPVKLNWTEGITTWEAALLSNAANSPVASEVFTGYPMDSDNIPVSFEVDPDSEGFSTEIKCRRAVAGVLLYLKNIPSHLKAEQDWFDDEVGTGIIGPSISNGQDYPIHEVALVTAGYNPVCNAVSRLWEEGFIYDRSGFRLTRLASISLDPDEAAGKDYHEKTFPAVGNFVMPSNTVTVKDNPLLLQFDGDLASPELLAFDKSLYLCFFTKVAGDSYFPVKFWPVKLVRSYIQDEDSEDVCAGDLGLERDNPFNYNLVANHLYCLGMYEEGGVDKPVDLKKEQEEHVDGLKIVVLGSWQFEINIEM